MVEQLVENVLDTAFLIAMQRAIESDRSDALFHDPLAGRLAGERGQTIVARHPRAAVNARGVAIRTVIIDKFVTTAVAAGIDTVLNLGAGLDTRPYRLNLPDTLRWIEVDHAAMNEYKESHLANERVQCKLERKNLDLSDTAARRAFLDRTDAGAIRLLVLTEGVVPYLSLEDAAALADDLRRMKSIDSWVIDYFGPEMRRFRKRASRALKAAPLIFEPPDWFAFFAQHGFRPREKRFVFEEGKRLGRPAPLPPWLRTLAATRRWLMSPTQRKVARERLGYFLMEPI